jgi:hypothetical protein
MSTTRQNKITRSLRVRLRPFREEDYPRFVEIGNLSDPEFRWTVEEARYLDASITCPMSSTRASITWASSSIRRTAAVA